MRSIFAAFWQLLGKRKNVNIFKTLTLKISNKKLFSFIHRIWRARWLKSTVFQLNGSCNNQGKYLVYNIVYILPSRAEACSIFGCAWNTFITKNSFAFHNSVLSCILEPCCTCKLLHWPIILRSNSGKKLELLEFTHRVARICWMCWYFINHSVI